MNSRAQRTGRLQLAIRKQQGRLLAPAMLSALHVVLGDEHLDVHVLSLEDTDRLFDLFSKRFQSCLAGARPGFHLRVARSKAEVIFSRLRRLGVELGEARVTFFGRNSHFTGAVEIPAGRLFPAAESLLRLEREDLRVASPDGAQGFLVDNLDRENQLELWCWGARWSELIMEDPPKGT